MKCEHCGVADARLCVVPHGPAIRAMLLCGQCVDLLPHNHRGLRGHTIDSYPARDIAEEWTRFEEPMRRALDHHVRLLLELGHRGWWR